MTTQLETTSPVIFYDASCGLCTAGTRRWGPMLSRRGIGLRPLQDPEVVERLGLQPGEVPDEMKLQTPQGQILGGADALLYVARRVWWAFPIYLLSFIPGMRWLMHWGYRRLASNRHRISRACKLS
jgi:predicted DCC family thiol-disulfide oxidoreductase YuxK